MHQQDRDLGSEFNAIAAHSSSGVIGILSGGSPRAVATVSDNPSVVGHGPRATEG